MSRRLDEEETAVDSGILHVAFSMRRELLAEVCRVLVLDVLDDGIPAGRVSYAGGTKPIDRKSPFVVVHEVAISRRVDDVEP